MRYLPYYRPQTSKGNITMSDSSTLIVHQNTADLTVAAHSIKSLLNIKFTRAKERHARAMGFASSDHLLADLKVHEVERDFALYMSVLKAEALANHQIVIDDDLTERLKEALC